MPLLNYIRSTLNPAAFHGRGKRAPFFEGWYYKLVDAQERNTWAVIPGVFFGASGGDCCFVQVFNGRTGRSTYHEYPVEEFRWVERSFDVGVGPNRFTGAGIVLDIADQQGRYQGELQLLDPVPWPVSWTAPGVMGWYAWAPFMQCYHGVVSLDHALAGRLCMDGQEVDFSGGRGYAEKDWGRSFPSSWIWFQTNHFDEVGTSLTASAAIIPWVRGAFPGFIIGLWHGQKLYRFATYTGAQLEVLDIGSGSATWVVRDRAHRLEMVATCGANTGRLRAPTSSGMDRCIEEDLNARVEVRLSAVKGGRQELIYSGLGRHAGLEMVGDLSRLVNMWKGRSRA